MVGHLGGQDSSVGCVPTHYQLTQTLSLLLYCEEIDSYIRPALRDSEMCFCVSLTVDRGA